MMLARHMLRWIARPAEIVRGSPSHGTQILMKNPASAWDTLYSLAEVQQGLFTTEQAVEAGFSHQLIANHVRTGALERVRRGIYRVARFPSAQRGQEDLMAVWLWSNREGVLSHETALQLHELSDALPSVIHVTVPQAWERRRVRVPDNVRVHTADVPAGERTWVGAVPVTTAARTISDVAAANGDPLLVDAAVRQALLRNLVALADVADAVAYVSGDAPHADGTWVVDRISGSDARSDPAQWRRGLDRLAEVWGCEVRRARYSRETARYEVELWWRFPPPPRPTRGEIVSALTQVAR